MSNSSKPIRRALISVADKSGIIEFTQQLQNLGVEILATGNTAALLRQNGIKLTEVSEYTQFPEIMGGRVKTLHPKIHGGILARRDEDLAVAAEHGIDLIDLVVINLYPFAQTIQKPDCTLKQAIEQIDVGGPAMLRAAAKNHAAVTVVIDPNDYAVVLKEMQAHAGQVDLATRQQLALKVFAHTGQYDQMIANYLGQQFTAKTAETTLPDTIQINLNKTQELRYGENPQQAAAFYSLNNQAAMPWQLQQGKPLSFNNLVDADVAWNCVINFSQPACVIVKHANPCGVAIADSLTNAYQKAYAADSTSAFGGIIALNQPADSTVCAVILAQQFVEVIIAPSFTNEALQLLASKPNIRALSASTNNSSAFPYDIKRLSCGILLQELDTASIQQADCKIVTARAPTEKEWQDLLFAWHVVKWVKSNAIVYVKNQQTVGIGAGQTSRVSSAELGVLKAHEAKLTVTGACVASDAFYPFRDGVDAAAIAGVTAIIQPGGSMRDAEVIAAANEHGLAMVFTGVRHFKH
jgi:phosphoribosylaminoimidazolecarboxamide formyltransferase/IMP cyclohydrolase